MQLMVINIVWEKILYDLEINKKNQPTDLGLYQVCGYHPVYGNDTLLYIGKTTTTFSDRLYNEYKHEESSNIISTHYRLGRIAKPKEDDLFGWDFSKLHDMIGLTEIILIKAHSPAMNMQHNTGAFSSELKEIHLIFNWGNFGRLLPEVSSLRTSKYYWDSVHNQKTIL